MAELKTGKPYIWVTWITGLLAGDKHCQWSAWFAAHYDYKAHEREDRFDLEKWKIEHNAMVRARVQVLEAAGWTCFIEGQNAFKIIGKTGTTWSGKMDIVAIKRAHAGEVDGPDWLVKIIDCKSGRPRDADTWQLFSYRFAFKLAEMAHRYGMATGDHLEIGLEVEYQTQSRVIPPHAYNQAIEAHIIQQIQLTAGKDEPRRVPSYEECRFCDISAKDCPVRQEPAPETTTEAF